MNEENKESACSLTSLPQKTIDIFSCAEETLNLWDKFMSESYMNSVGFKNLEDDLSRFYDGLIWAEKKNPLLVYQMFEMEALAKIVHKYVKSFPLVLLRGSIILVGNCEPKGLIAENIIESGYMSLLARSLLSNEVYSSCREEIEEYFNNFLKCYHRIFHIDQLPKFIVEGNRFELLEMCLKFYNNNDLLARTNGLNIVLDLLGYAEVRNFIRESEGLNNIQENESEIKVCKGERRRGFYGRIFGKMSKLFRNELVEFGLRIGHVGGEDDVDLIIRELEDKIALWEDISGNCEGIEMLLKDSFYKNVIIPLIVGPLNSKDKPLFTLKFSLFVSKKLIPVMCNLSLLESYLKAILTPVTLEFTASQLSKSISKPFTLPQTLPPLSPLPPCSPSEPSSPSSSEEEEESLQPYIFYTALFDSKDNHFILIRDSLLTELSTLLHSPKSIDKGNWVERKREESRGKLREMGFAYGGALYAKYGKKIIHEIPQMHRISTIESLLDTLVCLTNCKSLDTELENCYGEIYQQVIKQLNGYLETSYEVLQNLAEVFEYDINIIESNNDKSNKEKFEELFKVVFVWDVQKEEQHTKNFYSRVPESPSEHLRYTFIKYLLLLKHSRILTQGGSNLSVLEKYYSKLITKCPFIPGDLYNKNDVEIVAVEWGHVNGKDVIQGVFVKDDNFFVLGIENQNGFIEIVEGVHIKHVSITENKKILKISIKSFSIEKSEAIVKKAITMKSKSDVVTHLKNRIRVNTMNHVGLLKEILEKTESEIPETSFL